MNGMLAWAMLGDTTSVQYYYLCAVNAQYGESRADCNVRERVFRAGCARDAGCSNLEWLIEQQAMGQTLPGSFPP